MYLISSFEHNIKLELALTRLEQIGITKAHIYSVPLSEFTNETRLFDTIHRADGISLLDAGLAWATALTVVGSSLGFALRWGPIVWGIIGAMCGFLIGYILDLMIHRKRRPKKKSSTVQANVFILVHCDQILLDKVKAIFRDHNAINYGVIDHD